MLTDSRQQLLNTTASFLEEVRAVRREKPQVLVGTYMLMVLGGALDFSRFESR